MEETQRKLVFNVIKSPMGENMMCFINSLNTEIFSSMFLLRWFMMQFRWRNEKRRFMMQFRSKIGMKSFREILRVKELLLLSLIVISCSWRCTVALRRILCLLCVKWCIVTQISCTYFRTPISKVFFIYF